ncbi:phospholipase A and acyltransferase 3-like [Trematomus bernacchii]|uniref:phospholipase A and acyltransferase 3-like n=1 Tax=Trematomus bernacchii TaxID=40690 RepID=UPI00146C9EB9|nr:phospholipase A and acyltransferase 3-like [Trematomus bernacchii]XP_034005644.1 phospholipase A and acyltransferase 3-like [Trematomus bernacchii]
MAPSKYLKPGDLIEISKGIYNHWAVYVGDGFVVHMAPTSDVPGASSSSLMSVRNEKAVVKKEKLTDVVGNDKWKLNNSMDKDYKPRPAEDIVRDACARVGETLHYSVFQHNCEHFAKELRYRKAKSKQACAGGLGMCFSAIVVMGSSVLFPPAAVIAASLYVSGVVLAVKN